LQLPIITDRFTFGRRHRLRGGVALLGFALSIPVLGVPARAQQAAPAPAVAPAAASEATPVATAIGLLLEKAQFWYEKGRPDVALDFYNRVLSLQPDNGDALIGASKVSLDMGHEAQAKDYVEKLRKIVPDDPYVTGFDSANRRTPTEGATLAEARHFYVLGRKDDALAKYRGLFKDNKIPLDLAAEYYPLYISTLPEESVEADDALTTLKGLAADNPKDLALQLSAGQAMVSIEGSRAEGIERLHQLSKIPSVSNRARAIWRQALLWQGADFQSQDQLEEYLKDNPTDPELEAKRAEYRASLPNPGLRARMNGYEAVRTKDAKSAEKYFQAAIDYDAKDADAVVMMAVVRQMQGRTAEWKALLDKAIALAPDRRQEFLGMLGADPVANAKAAAEASRAVIAQYQEVDRLASAGKFDDAIKLLRSLIGSQHNPGSYIELADIQTRANRIDDAEASLRTALADQPDNADANLALAGLLNRQGKTAEAKALLARAEEGYTKTNNTKGLQALRSAKADQMRVDALAVKDPAGREAALREALAVDPSSWWIRLEIARTLQLEGHGSDGQQMMDEAARAAAAPGAVDTNPGRDALQVAFIWAEEHNDAARAQSLAQLVPEAKRSAGMKDLLAQAAFKQQVRAAAANPQQLLALAARPDPTGDRGVEIARAFLKTQDVPNLRRALALALQNTPTPTGRQRLAYAGILMEANQLQAARSMLDSIDAKGLTPDQRTAMDGMFDAMVANQADTLMQQHHLAEAQQLVQAQLARRPDSTTLKVAMARVQIEQGHPDAGLPVLLAVLEKDPGNLAARMGAIEASIASNRLSQADDLATDGMKLYPRDPFLPMQAANVARLRGMNGRALDYMVKARELRASQLAPGETSSQAE
jgi:tetratricopeptide (TPR) repeat protein